MHIVLVGAELEENLAIRSLQAAVEQAGHAVDVVAFDHRRQLEVAARRVAESGAKLVGLSMVFTARAREFAELAQRVRALGFAGRVVAGGHFAAFHAEQLLRDVPALDCIAVGEGELILGQLATNTDLAEIRGLVWRATDGVVHRNALAAKPNLDLLPAPRHREPFDDFLGLPIANVLGSRGCTHHCSFCSISAWHRLTGGPRHRERSPGHLAAEMAMLYRRGVRVFNFHDDNFLATGRRATLQRLDELEWELRRREVGRIAFAIKARPDRVDPVVFARLVRLGLFRVFLGIEAGTEASLLALGRRQTLADNVDALATVNRLDIHACFNLLVLNPDSTLEDFLGNVDFLARHADNPTNFCRTEIYAGTPLQERLAGSGRLHGDYWGYDYTIADARAQLAFEIVYPVFAERNYGLGGLHHQTMAVDYEQQLLNHFYGSPRGVREQVKAFVRSVNRDTADTLREVGEGIGAGSITRTNARGIAQALTRRVREANRRLGAEAAVLRAELARAAAAQRGARRGLIDHPWVRTAAAAGLATTIGASAAACRTPHMTEMAPQPTEPRDPSGPRDPGEPSWPEDDVGPDAGPLPTTPTDDDEPGFDDDPYYSEMAPEPMLDPEALPADPAPGPPPTEPAPVRPPEPPSHWAEMVPSRMPAPTLEPSVDDDAPAPARRGKPA